MNAQEKVLELAKIAGITISTSKSEPADIIVHNNDFFSRILAGGSLALGESYMDGWWDADDLAAVVTKVVRANIDEQINPLSLVGHVTKAKLVNLQSKKRSFQVGQEHYDIGNALYEKMLDSRMVYTCAYWKDAQDLDAAQEAKLDLVCKKIGLKEGDRVLDIGCGWGSFMKFAAEKYGAICVGLTVSVEQAKLGAKRCEGLPVEFVVEDYRNYQDKEGFDHIVSIGMFEHVGYKNYRVYFEKVKELLKDDGLFLLHTIGRDESAKAGDPWIDKYIFPNGLIPSVEQVGTAMSGLFVMEDWHNFGPDYDKTLTAWYNNFEKAWPKLKKDYSDRFYRMWTYYLLVCSALFRARRISLWQLVLSKEGLTNGYTSIR